GELCDCYETREEGVLAITDAVQAAAEGRPVRVWQSAGVLSQAPTWIWHSAGKLVEPSWIRLAPLSAAAKNWLALATFAGRFARKGTALLIDLGSTTTDIVPLSSGLPVPNGYDDMERLRRGELVYTGARRTPICALIQERVAAEWFATTLDV